MELLPGFFSRAMRVISLLCSQPHDSTLRCAGVRCVAGFQHGLCRRWVNFRPSTLSPPRSALSLSPDIDRMTRQVRFVPTGDIAFSSVAPRLPAQSSTFKTTIAISVATIMTDIIMTDIVTNPNTKKSGSCEKIT
jgi:hypothetical protein